MSTRKITLIILSFASISIILWALALNSMKENFFANGYGYGSIAYSSSEDEAYEQALVKSLEHYFAESYKADALLFDVSS